MNSALMPAFRVIDRNQPAQLVETPVPTPEPNQVLIQVGGAGLCASDLKVLQGVDTYNITYPLTLGHENAGWIAQVGQNVTGWHVGQPVVVSCLGGCDRCAQCTAGFTQYCATPLTPGITYDGGLASYVIANVSQIVALGDLPVAQAAPLADAGMTSYHAVELCHDIFGPRDTLLLIGMGGLGSLAVQIAQAKGWQRIIVCDVAAEKRAKALELGATDFVVSTSELAEDLRKLTGGDGISAVIDLVGIDATLQTAVDVVRPGGRVVQVGTGPGSIPFGRGTIKPGVSLVQSRGGNIGDLHAVVAMAERGELVTDIEPISLADVSSAYERMAAGKLTRRAVVVFGHPEESVRV